MADCRNRAQAPSGEQLTPTIIRKRNACSLAEALLELRGDRRSLFSNRIAMEIFSHRYAVLFYGAMPCNLGSVGVAVKAMNVALKNDGRRCEKTW